MPSQGSVPGGELKTVAVIAFVIFLSGDVCALEPVSALEDGFAIPSSGNMVDAVPSYPGSESFISGGFVSGAWSVPYGVDELAITTCHGGFNCGRVILSASYSGSGFDLYGEDHEKLGISGIPFTGLSVGIRITRSAMHIKGFGHASAVSTDAGVVLRPHDSVYFAGAIEDIAGAELGESHEPLDGRLRLAGSWRTPGFVTLLASITKVRRFESSVAAGFTAEVARILTAGVVGATEPDRFEFLCTVKAKRAGFSYRGSYHRDLGMSHGFSLCWNPLNHIPSSPSRIKSAVSSGSTLYLSR